ncbi:zf-DHHC-domain-containing protein [Abortiporus biennis]|nr:zf-DHHC-domain-containing protein [Abortiporus biennis]
MVDGHGDHPNESKCCGVVERAVERSREKSERRKNKPQPWIVLKLAVGMTAGILGYAFYVYIGRLCVPMIRDNDGALGGRNIGIPFLITFCLLGIMTWWTYIKIVFTGPGKARDHTSKCDPPILPANYRWWGSASEIDLGGGPFIPVPQDQQQVQSTSYPHGGTEPSSDGHTTIPSAPSFNMSEHVSEKNKHSQAEENAGVMDTLPPVQRVRMRAEQSNNGSAQPKDIEQGIPAPSNQLPMRYTRKPSSTPVLNPEYRYCHKDGFLKPYRAHHCRACGTCILKYDHHCPWIGQCVGARNHKFFVNFLFWAMWFCLWTFSTLLANVIKMNQNPRNDIDPQQVVIVAFAALFSIFTSTLLATHIRMILYNFTTVESFSMSRMKEREQAVLGRLFKIYQFGEKRRARKQWDAEWGRIGIEGNIWYLGSLRSNWESVMGHSVLYWIFPIGESDGDGINWTVNPRFDKEGRWRPRREWPEELR